MKEVTYPKALIDSTDEILSTHIINTYWNYIKLHFKFKLKYNPQVFDYYHTVCVGYDDFYFRITQNYKIEFRKTKTYDEQFADKRLEEIKAIIQKYYPKIYT